MTRKQSLEMMECIKEFADGKVIESVQQRTEKVKFARTAKVEELKEMAVAVEEERAREAKRDREEKEEERVREGRRDREEKEEEKARAARRKPKEESRLPFMLIRGRLVLIANWGTLN